MNLRDFDQSNTQLADSLDSIAQLVAKLNLNDDVNRLRSRATQLREDTFRVMVLGEFKRGKSTLLNAMLGADVLASKVTECTAVITRIRYADSPRVVIVREDGTEETLTVRDFCDQFRLKIEDTVDREDALDRFSQVEHAVVYYPIELCKHRVELVDSPGLGANPKRTKRTHGYLPQADAVVFVLDATQFLKEGESHFLESILLPLGLRNIFFVINKWNIIDESVIRPEDADRERAELNEHIRRRLGPFCLIDGVDRSAERIFRVNALGALRAQMAKPTNQPKWTESQVPQFQEALTHFLLNDRARAKHAVLEGLLRQTEQQFERTAESRKALAAKSVAEISAEIARRQPKLERLRNVRDHILHYLDCQSINLQDRLVISLQNHLAKIESDVSIEVAGFNLQQFMAGSMVWKAATDWTKAEEDKFGKQVERFLRPRITQMLERRMAVWQQSVMLNETRSMEAEVQDHLRKEAAEFYEVRNSIQGEITRPKEDTEIQDLLNRWLHPEAGCEMKLLEFRGSAALVDLSALLGSFTIDMAIQMVAHASTLWIPLIGVAVSAGRLLWREKTLRDEFVRKVEEGLRNVLHRLASTEGARLRETVKQSFSQLRHQVGVRIDTEIASIDTALQVVLTKKRDQEYSAEQELAFLHSTQSELRTDLTKARRFLV